MGRLKKDLAPFINPFIQFTEGRLYFFCKADNHLILLPSKLQELCMFCAQQEKDHSLERRKKKKKVINTVYVNSKFGD